MRRNAEEVSGPDLPPDDEPLPPGLGHGDWLLVLAQSLFSTSLLAWLAVRLADEPLEGPFVAAPGGLRLAQLLGTLLLASLIVSAATRSVSPPVVRLDRTQRLFVLAAVQCTSLVLGVALSGPIAHAHGLGQVLALVLLGLVVPVFGGAGLASWLWPRLDLFPFMVSIACYALGTLSAVGVGVWIMVFAPTWLQWTVWPLAVIAYVSGARVSGRLFSEVEPLSR